MRRFDKHIPIEKIIKRRRTAGDFKRFWRPGVPSVDSCLEDRVGHMTFCDPGDGLGKRDRRAFALEVKRRLLPRVQHVEFLLGLVEGAGVFRVHVEEIRAPVDGVPQKAGQIFCSVSSSILGSFLRPLFHPAKMWLTPSSFGLRSTGA